MPRGPAAWRRTRTQPRSACRRHRVLKVLHIACVLTHEGGRPELPLVNEPAFGCEGLLDGVENLEEHFPEQIIAQPEYIIIARMRRRRLRRDAAWAWTFRRWNGKLLKNPVGTSTGTAIAEEALQILQGGEAVPIPRSSPTLTCEGRLASSTDLYGYQLTEDGRQRIINVSSANSIQSEIQLARQS